MAQEKPEKYDLKGVKEVDHILHVPLFEIAKLGESFPNMTLQELQQIIRIAVDNLRSDSATLKRIPKFYSAPQDKRSLFDRLFKDDK